MSNVRPCSAVCEECERYPISCGGCAEVKGKVWWAGFTESGVCPFYACCVDDKGLDHCGKCADFPCDKFLQGDSGMSEEEHKAMLERQISILKSVE